MHFQDTTNVSFVGALGEDVINTEDICNLVNARTISCLKCLRIALCFEKSLSCHSSRHLDQLISFILFFFHVARNVVPKYSHPGHSELESYYLIWYTSYSKTYRILIRSM